MTAAAKTTHVNHFAGRHHEPRRNRCRCVPNHVIVGLDIVIRVAVFFNIVSRELPVFLRFVDPEASATAWLKLMAVSPTV